MNGLSNKATEQAGERDQVVVSLSTSETKAFASDPEEPVVSELVIEAEMIRRADAMTDVLARIIQRPAAPRHWGLNE